MLQQRGEGVRDHLASVATALIPTIIATAECHPAIWDLLRICALLLQEQILGPDHPETARVLNNLASLLSHEPLHVKELIGLSDISTSVAIATLTTFELKRLVKTLGSSQFMLAR